MLLARARVSQTIRRLRFFGVVDEQTDRLNLHPILKSKVGDDHQSESINPKNNIMYSIDIDSLGYVVLCPCGAMINTVVDSIKDSFNRAPSSFYQCMQQDFTQMS
jgi:hypothetical protein